MSDCLVISLSCPLQVDDDGEGAGPVVGIISYAELLPLVPHDITNTCDASRPVPLERWDVEDVQRTSPVPLEARFGAFVQDADLFDGAAFSISR